MAIVNIGVARNAANSAVSSGAPERQRGEGPVPVVTDRNEMLVRLVQERARIMKGGSCCIAVCAPDDNDRLPQALALRISAERFAHAMRAHDGIFHYGADKLLLCLPHIKSSDAAGVMGRLRKLVCAKPVVLEHSESVMLSVTLSGAMMNRFDFVEDTVAQAERALRSNLSAGGNRVCMLMPEV